MPTVEEELTHLLRDRAELVPADPQLARRAVARSDRLALRQRMLLAVAAAAAVAVAVGTPFVLGGPAKNTTAPVVANSGAPDFPVDAADFPLTFPLTPSFLPAGVVREPAISLFQGEHRAMYRLATDKQWEGRGIEMTVLAEEPQQPASASNVTINGKPGVLRSAEEFGMAIEWLRAPGQWVLISANLDGKVRTREVLVRVAEGLVDEEQPAAPLFEIAVAPKGYEVTGGDDQSLSIGPPSDAKPDERPGQIYLNLNQTIPPEQDAERTQRKPVQVGGREGQIMRSNGYFFILLPVPPASQLGVAVPATTPWTEERALEFAAGVKVVGEIPDWQELMADPGSD